MALRKIGNTIVLDFGEAGKAGIGKQKLKLLWHKRSE
jgi:hypothetical protein